MFKNNNRKEYKKTFNKRGEERFQNFLKKN